jgi:heavy metal sensor kinase
MKRWTLRTTLTFSYAAVLALFLGALGLAYYHVFARQLDADATAELREMTRAVHGYLRFEGGTPVLAYDPEDPDQVTFVQEATRYYQVYDANRGDLLIQSPALEPLGLHYTTAEVRAFVEHPAVFDVQTDQRRVRVSNSIVAPAAGARYLVQVGVPLDQRDAALRRFLSLLIWSLPVTLLAVLVVGRWMAGRALAPLARLASATGTIGVDDLRRRLPTRGVGDEHDAIADAFNGVVARLERGVREMKLFAAAMAHELRTPLAALRGEMELSLTDTASPDERRQRVASQLEEIDKLARLVGQLLLLAQADAGEIPLQREMVDLSALGASVVEALEPVAEAKNIYLICERSGQVNITGDRQWMERLLLNLVDNAIKFTPAGGTIIVSVMRAGRTAKLVVRDTGIGMAPDVVPHVFERFYRADIARSSQVDGAGLGLSLVRWIADRHGAAVDLESRPGHGSTFTISMPVSTAQSGDSVQSRTSSSRRVAA